MSKPSRKVLIVDDEPNIVTALEFLFKRSGYEVCQTMRERPDLAQIKVVMLSAKGSEAEINKGMALGADLYVTKPFSTQELVATIDRLFEPGSEPKQ